MPGEMFNSALARDSPQASLTSRLVRNNEAANGRRLWL